MAAIEIINFGRENLPQYPGCPYGKIAINEATGSGQYWATSSGKVPIIDCVHPNKKAVCCCDHFTDGEIRCPVGNNGI